MFPISSENGDMRQRKQEKRNRIENSPIDLFLAALVVLLFQWE